MANDSLTIREQKGDLWTRLATFSALLCVAFFITFLLLHNPFWVSIARFTAFIFFAVAVLSYLKIMDGPLYVTLSTSPELLLVSYKKKGETIQEEQFERNTIKKITPAPPTQNILFAYLQPDSTNFKISFTDTDRELYLFEFGGRPLLFGQPAKKKITQFLQQQGLKS